MLEKIINGIKKHGKKAVASVLIPTMLASPVKAADIEVWNWTTGGPTSSAMTIVTGDSYTEAYNVGEDAELAGELPPALEIFSKPSGVEVAVDKRPENTPGVDMDLRVKGTITGPIDNSIWFKVTNDSGLEHRKIIAYDTLNPETVYDINDTVGEWTTINLPGIVGRTDEVYARWHIATPTLVPGDCSSALGPGKLDGKFDLYDVQTMTSTWLEETAEGENYLNGDVNFDGINNFEDFAIGADNYTSSE